MDYAQVVKDMAATATRASTSNDTARPSVTSCKKKRIEGNPNMRAANTTCVERQNLSMRTGMRRFTRLTNAFRQAHREARSYMVNLYALHYNFCHIHKTLRVTPAMEAGLETTV